MSLNPLTALRTSLSERFAARSADAEDHSVALDELPGGQSPRNFEPKTPNPKRIAGRSPELSGFDFNDPEIPDTWEAIARADSFLVSPAASPQDASSESETGGQQLPPIVATMPSPSRKKVIAGALGDQQSELYDYPKLPSSKEVILSWLREHSDDAISVELLQDLQSYLFEQASEGIAFGPTMIPCIWDTHWEGIDYLAVNPELPIDLREKGETFGKFFGLNKNTKRQLYEPNINALLHHHTRGVRIHRLSADEAKNLEHPHLERCGRCASDRYSKKFGECRTVFLGEERLMHGTCTNCIYNGSYSACSMTCSNAENVFTSADLLSADSLPTGPVSSRTRLQLGHTAAEAEDCYDRSTVAWCKLGHLDLPSKYCSEKDKDYRPHSKLRPFDLINWGPDGPSEGLEAENEALMISRGRKAKKKKKRMLAALNATQKAERKKRQRDRRRQRRAKLDQDAEAYRVAKSLTEFAGQAIQSDEEAEAVSDHEADHPSAAVQGEENPTLEGHTPTPEVLSEEEEEADRLPELGPSEVQTPEPANPKKKSKKSKKKRSASDKKKEKQRLKNLRR